jgi:hypothetical protein
LFPPYPAGAAETRRHESGVTRAKKERQRVRMYTIVKSTEGATLGDSLATRSTDEMTEESEFRRKRFRVGSDSPHIVQ